MLFEGAVLQGPPRDTPVAKRGLGSPERTGVAEGGGVDGGTGASTAS